MKITIKTFATVKDLLGFDEKEITIPEGSRVEDIIQKIREENPSFNEIKDSLLIAVNEEYCSSKTILNKNDILAIFPPVSGG